MCYTDNWNNTVLHTSLGLGIINIYSKGCDKQSQCLAVMVRHTDIGTKFRLEHTQTQCRSLVRKLGQNKTAALNFSD